ncbi:MAG: DinB family protein [Actinobacteria bacterium]|nr:DinB family protein [Actinomycetota bacterium]
MTYYGAKELRASFETVRKNTITIAEEISADKYGFRAAPGTKSVAELLAHVAISPNWQIEAHGDHVSHFDFAFFGARMAKTLAAEQALATKDDVLKALRQGGDRFATFLGGLSEVMLQERVSFPPPIQPESKTRFEMLLGVKEHEMHHRGQLMLIERMLGIVPHLTRAREASRAQAAGGGAR